jgi:hypothetical protein
MNSLNTSSTSKSTSGNSKRWVLRSGCSDPTFLIIFIPRPQVGNYLYLRVG